MIFNYSIIVLQGFFVSYKYDPQHPVYMPANAVNEMAPLVAGSGSQLWKVVNLGFTCILKSLVTIHMAQPDEHVEYW